MEVRIAASFLPPDLRAEIACWAAVQTSCWRPEEHDENKDQTSLEKAKNHSDEIRDKVRLPDPSASIHELHDNIDERGNKNENRRKQRRRYFLPDSVHCERN